MKKFLSVIIAICVGSSAYAADIESMPTQSNNHTNISVSANTSESNWKKSPKPTSKNNGGVWGTSTANSQSASFPSGAKAVSIITAYSKNADNSYASNLQPYSQAFSGTFAVPTSGTKTYTVGTMRYAVCSGGAHGGASCTQKSIDCKVSVSSTRINLIGNANTGLSGTKYCFPNIRVVTYYR
ncbi:hypothetical protein [Vibrio gangliei]|uniref:hypothetical protein n=1 Tax=Vibrio gangliei TaxID=2077090 RepID=UPI0013003C88|nr:hypothetical protein [Vibrio gangliei]